MTATMRGEIRVGGHVLTCNHVAGFFTCDPGELSERIALRNIREAARGRRADRRGGR